VLGVKINSGHRRTRGGSHVNDFFVRLYLFARRDRGQTMAEYVIVLGVITVTLMLALTALGGSVTSALGKVTRDL
jgi:Flp pilus assembly pilin Flp